MTRIENLQKIKEACIDCNHEIDHRENKTVRLADVLYMFREGYYHSEDNEYYLQLCSGDICYWNLVKDNLDEQSDETLEFISNLLK